jgi:3-deoxy-D-manno-octulosonic-acid transferase
MRAYVPMIKTAFILNFLKIYNILWQAALPFLKKSKRLEPSFPKQVTANHFEKADIWIQAASAGEAFIAVSLLTSLKPKQKTKVLITATTSQGLEILESGLLKNKISSNINYCLEWFPFDMPNTIQAAVSRVNPRVMVLLETEIWPALLYYLKENQTRIFIINARLSNKSARHYKLTRFLWSLLSPDHILAISPSDARKYARVFKRAKITTMPNIKFDLMETDPGDNGSINAIKDLIPKKLPLSILASIRRQEEKQVINILHCLVTKYPSQVVAIFPRHMHRIDAWKKKLNQKGLSFQLRSNLLKSDLVRSNLLKSDLVKSNLVGSSHPVTTDPININPITTGLETTPVIAPGIILWDTFGELRAAYGLACTVFVGGSLKPLGGQNFIEPAAQGPHVVTGPYLNDFTWVGKDIFRQEIVTRCNNWQAVAQTMVSQLNMPMEKSRLRQKALDYIQKKRGGTKIACQIILDQFKP